MEMPAQTGKDRFGVMSPATGSNLENPVRLASRLGGQRWHLCAEEPLEGNAPLFTFGRILGEQISGPAKALPSRLCAYQ